MKFVLQIVLISCLALGAFGQSDLTTASPAPDAATTNLGGDATHKR